MDITKMDITKMDTTKMDYQFAAKFVKAFEKIDNYNQFDPSADDTDERTWCWHGLTTNPVIPMAYIEKHPKKPWDTEEINCKIRNEGDESYMRYLHHKYANTEPPSTRITSLDANGVPQDWSACNVSLALIEKQMEYIEAQNAIDEGVYRVIWSYISDNPNLTPEFIEKYYQKPWNYYVLAINPLIPAKQQFKKEYAAACIIQQAYARAKYIPSYAYCRKLHLQFYNSMFNP